MTIRIISIFVPLNFYCIAYFNASKLISEYPVPGRSIHSIEIFSHPNNFPLWTSTSVVKANEGSSPALNIYLFGSPLIKTLWTVDLPCPGGPNVTILKIS